MTVTALLVSHDGARWLPAVLDGLEAQSRRPDRILAVDTGSTDGSLDLLRERLGPDVVVKAPPTASYPEAVRLGLDRARGSSDEEDWVWLLHDDSAPAPDALEVLLDTAHAYPSVSVLGPKLREWPSLRRLLELGVTISGTGRRETGLERGEYDQGQHDNIRDVLAVNTAGMLVRRAVLEQVGGFDKRLPIFGNDIDFGWRVARAGHRTLVVPDAIVFHAEAAHRRLRRTPVTTSRPRRSERRGALYTLLVNCSLRALPFQIVRLFLGSLVRALGLLLVRAPLEAADELAALAATYLRPDRIVAGRARRSRTATVSPREVRHLLAPPWLPYRHGLDFVSDIAAAVVSQASEVSARRAQRVEATETGPVDAEAQNLPEDTGLLARLIASPTAWVFTVLTVLALVSTRGVLGSGMLWGGALLPAPDTALSWWRVYLESWHHVGVGSAAPAPPYLLPLALVGTLLLGKAWLLLDLVFFFAVPLAAYGGYRFLMRLTGTPGPALWGAVAYGVLPVVSGAVNQGRLGSVVAALVLPWLAHAALFLSPRHSADRRWRAAWRTALWLALLAAFVPLAWFLALVVAVLAVASRRGTSDRSEWGPVVLAVGVVPVLLLPWSVLTFGEGRAVAWLFEAGLPASSLLGALGPMEVVTGRAADVGAAPWWISIGVALAGVGALLRVDTRRRVVQAWSVLVVGLFTVALLSGRVVDHPSTSAPESVWLGFPLLLVQASAVTAAVMAGSGISGRLAGSSFSWRQPVGLVVVAAALVAPLAGVVWWVGTGMSGPLDRRAVDEVPTYMADAAAADENHGVLVVRGSARTGFEYVVLRDDGQRTGDDALAPTTEAQAPLTELVGNLAMTGEADDVKRLGQHGVEFIYAPPPADAVLAGNLDSVSGLAPASAIRPGSRAWQLEAEPSDEALPHDPSVVQPWLLAVQGFAVLTALVLAAPSRRVRR